MLVTLSGIVIEVKPVQSKNAELPMLVALVITTFFSDAGTNVFKLSLPAPKIYPNDADDEYVSVGAFPKKGKVILSSEVQPPNAALPILVTLSGTVTEIKPVQSENA